MRFWFNELSATMPESFVTCVVGNKVDMEADRKGPPDEGWRFAVENCALYQETSALAGHGVKEAFQRLCRKLIEAEIGKEALLIPPAGVELDQPADKNQHKECC
jgi:GTPase SAR1 family protein